MSYDPFGCPIRYWLSIFGDKWSLLIIRDIMLKKKQNYGQFQSAGEGISTSVLAGRLDHLEKQGIISKSPDQGHGKKFVYALTQKGEELADILRCVILWSERHDDRTLVDESYIAILKESPEA